MTFTETTEFLTDIFPPEKYDKYFRTALGLLFYSRGINKFHENEFAPVFKPPRLPAAKQKEQKNKFIEVLADRLPVIKVTSPLHIYVLISVGVLNRMFRYLV